MKTRKLFVAAVLLLSIGITGCSKPEKGEKGETGPAGTNGNANVTSATLNASTWTWDSSNQWSYATWSSVSILTSDAVNSGAVMVYEGSSGDWLACPYTIGANPIIISTNFEYQVNTMTVYKSSSDGQNLNPSTSIQYKLVCIPTRMMQQHPNIDLKNYKQVEAAFNLKK